ncbi:Sensor protein KdpD [Planctomycetes bacterium Poly30]|uniref:histidine kinase n=1 Tax=Saltatorellus ferox TaxID=2528018 RepID=A0A518ETS7_9BACT|nr:Sensor protein KdpD [Planctomycetes bacterium Poly30]
MSALSSNPSLARRAPAVVLTLGLCSAAALGIASFTDFGDPRVEARAQARLSADTQAREIQVRWSDLARAEGPLPGTLETYRIEDGEDLRGVLDEGLYGSDGRAVDPVLAALVASGRASLQRRQPVEALGAFEDALRQSKPDARDRESALFEAVRAAGVAGNVDAVGGYRTRLLESPNDVVVRGTSGRLLSMLVAPVNAEVAFTLLTEGEHVLPAPVDLARVENGELRFELDPWWKAIQGALKQNAPALDWSSAFQVDRRRAIALQRLIDVVRDDWTGHWTLVQKEGALFGLRRWNEALEMACIDEGALLAELGRNAHGDLPMRIAVEQARGLDPKPLPGSPYSVTCEPIDPEAAARPQLRRIRWIRAGLAGLGALVMLASIFSARAAARARRLARLRSTFVASVSHDLRTPTQAILLLAEALEQNLVDTEGARGRYHTQIRREAQRLRRLVEDLLDGARIDRGGGARIERRLVRTGPFFEELTSAMHDRAASSNAELRVTLASMPETIHVDPDGVHRAVWNLFENALAHGKSPENGARAAIEVRIACEGGVLRCEVADDGPGIPARHAESVFAPFERLVDRAAKAGIEKDTGTGLGLSIVRAIAEGHGGAARVEPSPRGARLVVTFQAEESHGDAA